MSSQPLESNDERNKAVKAALTLELTVELEEAVWQHALRLCFADNELASVAEVAFAIDRRPIVLEALRKATARLEKSCADNSPPGSTRPPRP